MGPLIISISVIALLVITACATMTPAPPPLTGLMWGYFTVTEPVGQPRRVEFVKYTPNRPWCESSREHDVKRADVEVSRVSEPRRTISECKRLAVGPGTEYWAFVDTYPDQSVIGYRDRNTCQNARYQEWNRTRGWTRECEPIAVKALP